MTVVALADREGQGQGSQWNRGESVNMTAMAPAAAIAAIFLGAMALRAESGATLSFLRSESITLGNQCCSVLTGDFNNDGKTDIAAAHAEAGITIFLGDGKGSFTRGDWPLALGAGVTLKGLVAAADLNVDGIADIVAITQD